ncbi:MAG TPA: methionyl-tRNA formyltransferase [Roseateles sp.]|uniref:methionyl-tRNA formyltransferase n=1 Tax=Roseateles sp. TaxID=1971397 RepID=UPI002EDA8E36
MRVVFAGTPEFAAVALDALLAAGFVVPLVLTQPDRPAGRGMKLQASAVKQRAVAAGIPVAQPQGLKLDGKYAADAVAAREALWAADADVMVVAAYGLILPQWVLDLPRRGCLNVHASLLPRWRGAAPIHRAIEAGDAETGITIMQMDAGLDTGNMLLIGRESIRPDDTTAVLHDRLAALGGRLIVEALQAAELHPMPQPAEGVTYAHKIEKAESIIDWRQPAAEIERRLRAFDPFPGGVAMLAGEAVKVWRAELAEGRGAPGEVIAPGPVVACGEGALRLTELQRAGGKRGPAAAFLQARPVVPGEHFDA